MYIESRTLFRRITLAIPVALLAWTQPCLAQIHVPADYPTIQAAVDAAISGMTITVAAGQYEEQVRIVGKDLSLEGLPGATLVSPAALDPMELGPLVAPRRPLLGAMGCQLDISGFAFDGLRRGGQIERFTGVLYVSAGGTIENCSFKGFREQSAGPLPFTSDPERAFQGSNGSGVVSIAVRACTFTDNAGAIFISGALNMDPNTLRAVCDIADNVVVGLGPQPFLAQNGIWLAGGARGTIRGNHVSGHQYLGGGNFSIAILTGSLGLPPGFVMQRVLIHGNTIIDNSAGIVSLFASKNLIHHNDVTGGTFGFTGIAVSGQESMLHHNSIDMGQSVVPGSSGVLLLGAQFNAGFGTGFATDTRVRLNTIAGATLPIWSQTGVTGTTLFGNRILP